MIFVVFTTNKMSYYDLIVGNKLEEFKEWLSSYTGSLRDVLGFAAFYNRHHIMRAMIPFLSKEKIKYGSDESFRHYDLETWKILYEAGVFVNNPLNYVKDAEVAKFLIKRGAVQSYETPGNAVYEMQLDVFRVLAADTPPTDSQKENFVRFAINSPHSEQEQHIRFVFENCVSITKYGMFALEYARYNFRRNAEKILTKMVVRETLALLLMEVVHE